MTNKEKLEIILDIFAARLARHTTAKLTDRITLGKISKRYEKLQQEYYHLTGTFYQPKDI